MTLTAKSTTESLKHLCQMLDTHKKVYFSRFGDGEVYTMFGADCLEHKASSALAEELSRSFDVDHELYLRAVGVNYPVERGMIHGLFAPYIDNFKLEKTLTDRYSFPNGAVFESQILFHYLTVFKPEVMNGFLDKYVRSKRKMFIGGTPKQLAEKLYGPIDFYIQTPGRDAYYRMDEWFPKVLEHVSEVDVIIPTVGVTSNIINYRLWNLGVEAHCLDIGSIVDAVSNRSSRKWIRLMGHRVNNVLVRSERNKSLSFKLKYLAKELWFVVRLMRKGRKWKVPY